MTNYAIEPVIAAGEFVTCERGHLICEVIRPIYLAMLGWTDCLGSWRLTEPPTVGGPMPFCPCGASWVMREQWLHIKGRGWVGPPKMQE